MATKKTEAEAVPNRWLVYEGSAPAQVEAVLVEPGEIIPEASALFALALDQPDFRLCEPE